MLKTCSDDDDEDLTLEDVSSAFPKVDMMCMNNVQPSHSSVENPLVLHSASPNIAAEEEREEVTHTHTAQEEDTTRMNSSSWGLLLLHIFFHAIPVGGVAGAVVISINKVYLYDHVVSTNATITYDSFFDSERIKASCAIGFPTQISVAIMIYGACRDGITMYDSRYVNYIRACCLSFLVVIFVSVFIQTWFVSQDRISPVIVAAEVVCCFFIFCLATKHNGGDRDCIMKIVWTGFYAIFGSTYASIVLVAQEVSSSSVFPWISPFIVPAATFLFRYAGQRSELPVPFITKVSCMISALSSVVSRMAQCAYLTNENIFRLFLAMEVFYDVVGVIIRVTLHHRQLIMDTIMSGTLWKDGKLNLQLTPQVPRNQLISSQTVAYSIIIEYGTFIALFATRASLLPSNDNVDVGKLIGVLIICSTLQMLCCFVTHALIRKVEAVPWEELDIDIVPLSKLWNSQYFFIAVVICFITGNYRYMYQTWFSMTAY